MGAPQQISVSAHDQSRFAHVVTQKLRESRRRQKLTQADVASRTRGLVSKAALANYETGHRSLRIDVLWVIVRALGEDLGDLLSQVESEVAGGRADETANSISFPAHHLVDSDDSRLEPVRRWFELRHRPGETIDGEIVVLEADAASALANLMQVTTADLRRMLTEPTATGR